MCKGQLIFLLLIVTFFGGIIIAWIYTYHSGIFNQWNKAHNLKKGIVEGKIVKGGHNEYPLNLRPNPPKGQGINNASS